MDSIELSLAHRRGRMAYELGRLRLALLGIAPLAVIVVVVSAWLVRRPDATLGFGLGAMALAAAMLWYGRDPQKAVLPGMLAGFIPLLLSLCASHFHACGPEGCTSLCEPACMLGGALAGLVVAGSGHRRRVGPWFWLSASSLALLTGAMGCSCLGYGGLIGLGLGFGIGVVPGLVRRAVSRSRV